ncbi:MULTISPECIES: DUF805 domain-containing protein [Hyphobacterium]|uniref:DUF805 domain-containing protein n=1 Tax=Hyphobacterium vulgare TaxID=1736751 RepID=A0ABV6ZTF5_9PROT
MGSYWAIFTEGMALSFEFSGRMKRRNYWLFVVMLHLLMVGLVILYAPLEQLFGPISERALLAAFLNSTSLAIGMWWAIAIIAASARRLRDAGRSPYCLLYNFVPIANLYLLYLLSEPSKAHFTSHKETTP